jgi:hypothetical protein
MNAISIILVYIWIRYIPEYDIVTNILGAFMILLWVVMAICFTIMDMSGVYHIVQQRVNRGAYANTEAEHTIDMGISEDVTLVVPEIAEDEHVTNNPN